MDDTVSAPMQDYLESIHELSLRGSAPRVRDIARAMRVKMPSVTAALRNLAAAGLLRHERYGTVELTPEGRELAQQVHRRHVTLVGFLTRILQLDPEQAEREACQLEHGLGSETLRRLLGLMEFVEKCPRSGGDWLAHMRGRWEDRECDHNCARCISQITAPPHGPFGPPRGGPAARPLSTCEPGFRGTVVRVAGHGPLRRRLLEMGVTAGTVVEFVRVAPLGDPLEIKLRGYHLTMRREEAAHVFVTPLEAE